MNRPRLLYIAVMFILLSQVAVTSLVTAFGESSVAPCTPAPATFATWVVCNTATAAARIATSTPRVVAQTQTPQATQTPVPTRSVTPSPTVTPTRITGTEQAGCWITTRDGVAFFIAAPCDFTVRQVP